MPIYEYKCENGHVFDVMQKLSDDPPDHLHRVRRAGQEGPAPGEHRVQGLGLLLDRLQGRRLAEDREHQERRVGKEGRGPREEEYLDGEVKR